MAYLPSSGSFCLLLFTLCTTCEGFYRKPWDDGHGGGSKLIPPSPATTPQPWVPVKYTVADKNTNVDTYNGDSVYQTDGTPPPDVQSGGHNSQFTTGWGIQFNIWIWIEVRPVTEHIFSWQFRTTTIPALIVVEWYTTEYTYLNWGSQIRAFDDAADEQKRRADGTFRECYSWMKTCKQDTQYMDDLLNREINAGRMRSIGGGTDSTDNTIIAFIVIAVLIGGGIGGVMYFQKKNAAALEEAEGGEGDADAEAKEEPAEEGEGEGEGQEKEAEEAS